MITIYKITSPTGRIYVGKTKELQKRIGHYKKWVNSITQPKLRYSIRKHGWDNHKLEILEECTPENANNREIFWIKELKSFHGVNSKGLNLTPGGDGGKGGRKRNKSAKRVEQRCPKTFKVIKKWRSVTIAAKGMRVSTTNIYAAIKGGKQIYSQGFIWCYAGTFVAPREYKWKDADFLREKGLRAALQFKNGGRQNPQKGKKGHLSTSPKPVFCNELQMEFGSIMVAAEYLKEQYYPSQTIWAVAERVRQWAHGNNIKNKDFTFKFI